MKVTKTKIKDLIILETQIYPDKRGWFTESYNQQAFDQILSQLNQPKARFIQDNLSFSHKNVLRGLHYQTKPYSQAKLIQVVQGSVWDVAVDLRQDSSTFGQWFGIEISAQNHKQLWIPAGFAHGFLTLQDNTLFTYKTTNFYAKEHEYSILWNDPDLNIKWPIVPNTEIIQSVKDQHAPLLKESLLISNFHTD